MAWEWGEAWDGTGNGEGGTPGHPAWECAPTSCRFPVGSPGGEDGDGDGACPGLFMWGKKGKKIELKKKEEKKRERKREGGRERRGRNFPSDEKQMSSCLGHVCSPALM